MPNVETKTSPMSNREFFSAHFPDREPRDNLEPTSSYLPVDSFKKTTRTKKRIDVATIASDMGVDPFAIMLAIAGNQKDYLGLAPDDDIKIDTRLKAATEAAGFMAPKLKSVEHTTTDGKGKIEHKTIIVLPSNNRDNDQVQETELYLGRADEETIKVILPRDEPTFYEVETAPEEPEEHPL